MSSAICFRLDRSKILLSGNELIDIILCMCIPCGKAFSFCIKVKVIFQGQLKYQGHIKKK